MIIPHDSLAQDTLDNIIEAFVLQEGTDYGLEEVSLESKINQVKQQLDKKSVVLVYSELYETLNIIPIDQFNQQAIYTNRIK